MTQALKVFRVKLANPPTQSTVGAGASVTILNRQNVRGMSRILGLLNFSTAQAATYPQVQFSRDGINWIRSVEPPLDASQVGTFQYVVDVPVRLPYVQVITVGGAALATLDAFLEAAPDSDDADIPAGGGGGGGGPFYSTFLPPTVVPIAAGAIGSLAAPLATGTRVRISLPIDPATRAGGNNAPGSWIYYGTDPAQTDTTGAHPGVPLEPGSDSGWINADNALYAFCSAAGPVKVIVERETSP